jgi:hypothetical protein
VRANSSTRYRPFKARLHFSEERNSRATDATHNFTSSCKRACDEALTNVYRAEAMTHKT